MNASMAILTPLIWITMFQLLAWLKHLCSKNTSNVAMLMSPQYFTIAGEALEEDDFDEEEEEEGSDAEEGKISSLSLTSTWNLI